MTKDFKNSDVAHPSEQYGISWVLGGVAVGLLSGAVVYALVNQQKTAAPTVSAAPANSQPVNTVTSPQTVAQASVQNELQEEPEERPGFSYHAVLPELELDVPIPLTGETPPPQQRLPVLETPRFTEVLLEQPPQRQAQQQPAPARQPAAVQQAPVTAQGRYMFQLGAYRDQRQAERMRQHARNNGLNTRVERAQVQGATWYRVRLGPTDNLQIVNRWKQMLSSMGISPIIIRM